MKMSFAGKGILFGLIVIFEAVTASQAQEKPFLKTPGGVKYMLHKVVPNAAKPVPGDVVELKLMYKTSSDSVLYDNCRMDYNFVHILEVPAYKGDLNEALALLGVGDSATFLLRADSFYLKTLREKKLPRFIKKGSELTFNAKMVSVTPNQEYMKKQMDYMTAMNAKAGKSRKQEADSIKRYLEVNKINVAPTNSGLYVIPEREGNGPQPVEGNKAVVDYKGFLLNGKPFDSSYDKGSPLEFKIGGHAVVHGFEEAVKTMKKGGKAKVIVPFNLGYNDNEVGDIPAFSTLIFEIELLDVK